MFRAAVLICCVPCLAEAADAQWVCKPAGPALPVPSPAAIAAAQGGVVRALVEQIVRQAGGNVWGAQFHIQQAASSADQPAVRYLLLEESIALAERAGDAAAAVAALGELAHNFRIDERERSLAIFARLRDGSPAARIAAAMSALARAEQATTAELETDMLRFHDAALRCALLGDDTAVYEYVRDRIDWLRAARAAFTQLAAGQPIETGSRQAAEQLSRLLAADAAQPPALAEMRALLPELPHDRGERPLLSADAMLALADHARDELVRTSLRRLVCSGLAEGLDSVDTATVAQRCRTLAALLPRIATARGIHALQFRDDHDLGQLVCTNGRWRVRDGLLLGAADGANNFATHRLRFGTIRAVLVRGGIRSADGLNFRVHVGDFSLLLNWEVRPENHLWSGTRCEAKGPPALTVGTEHTILLVSGPRDVVHVCIDDTRWWTAPGRLVGTVTVYPALGSEIFVREILVDGEPVAATTGPVGSPM